MSFYISGSPPHTWRIPAKLRLLLFACRITSTYVENTLEIKDLLPLSRDHLHIRGEYTGKELLTTLGKGSPPHTWRILGQVISYALTGGITSTYVENTNIYGIAVRRPQGSPPHTWRIRREIGLYFASPRITSTYVENTVNKSHSIAVFKILNLYF